MLVLRRTGWPQIVKPRGTCDCGLMLGRRVFVLVVAAPLLLIGCGGGGEAKPAAQAIDDWVRAWRGEVNIGPRPNRFSLPVPPAVELPTVADDLGRNVQTAANDFSDDVGLGYAETKNVFCTWFAWYVETRQTVPTQEDFPALLLRYGFRRVLNGPPSQRFRDAAELFRASLRTRKARGNRFETRPLPPRAQSLEAHSSANGWAGPPGAHREEIPAAPIA